MFNTEGHPLPVKVEYLVGHNVSYEALVKTCELENGTSCYTGLRKMGVCRKINFKRKLSAYGFDLVRRRSEERDEKMGEGKEGESGKGTKGGRKSMAM